MRALQKLPGLYRLKKSFYDTLDYRMSYFSHIVIDLAVSTAFYYSIMWMMREGWSYHRNLLPLLFSNSGVNSLASHKNHCKCCRTAATVFLRPYPRRLESLIFCRCHYKGSTFFSVI